MHGKKEQNFGSRSRKSSNFLRDAGFPPDFSGDFLSELALGSAAFSLALPSAFPSVLTLASVFALALVLT